MVGVIDGSQKIEDRVDGRSVGEGAAASTGGGDSPAGRAEFVEHSRDRCVGPTEHADALVFAVAEVEIRDQIGGSLQAQGLALGAVVGPVDSAQLDVARQLRFGGGVGLKLADPVLRGIDKTLEGGVLRQALKNSVDGLDHRGRRAVGG